MALTKLIFPPFLSDEAYKARQVSFQPMTRDIDHNSAESALKDRSFDTTNYITVNLGQNLAAVAGSTGSGFAIEGIIVLPLPGEISDSQSHSWNEEEGIVSKGVEAALKSATDFLSKSDLKGDNMMGKFLENVSYTSAYLHHKSGVRKELTDPGMFQSYKGSNPRSFSLSFTLIPNNADEAELIRKIIIAFKKYSSPSICINNVSLNAPYYWMVTFENPAINSMFRMDCVVITNVSVDYGDGDMQLFVDGFPKMIKLNLSLQEARLTYADNYENLGFGNYETEEPGMTVKKAFVQAGHETVEAAKQTYNNIKNKAESAIDYGKDMLNQYVSSSSDAVDKATDLYTKSK